MTLSVVIEAAVFIRLHAKTMAQVQLPAEAGLFSLTDMSKRPFQNCLRIVMEGVAMRKRTCHPIY